MRYQISELGIGGILDQAVALTKNHFKMLFTVTLVMMVPIAVVTKILAPGPDVRVLMAAKTSEEFRMAIQDASQSSPLATPFALLYAFIVVPLTNAAIIHVLASEYLGKPTSVGGAFRRAGRLFFPLIGTTVLATVGMAVGFCLCFIPYLILGVMWALRTEVVVIEGVYFVDALKRSWKLVRGNVGTMIVLVILILVVNLAIMSCGFIIPQPQLSAILGAVLQAAAFIFGSAVWVVFYFSCRSKAEHFDLTTLADAVGADDVEPPQLEYNN